MPKFAAYSLLFTVPKSAPKLHDCSNPLGRQLLRGIIRRSYAPFSQNSLLISLFLSFRKWKQANVAFDILQKPKAFVRRKKCFVSTQVLHRRGFAGGFHALGQSSSSVVVERGWA